ncbi:hypothetical protein HFP69_12100 [Streptomyces sp. ARC12]|uniref:hypothetical protein n=1 Tax=Streptomyces sp. ARC12 TaxID=2724151 RepID=UPI0038573CD0
MLIIAAKTTIEAVARVAPAGSSLVLGTTKKNSEAAGKKAAPMIAMGMRLSSTSW